MGTLVTGYNRGGLFGLPGHKGHPFRIVSRPTYPKWTNAGYQQSVRCLFCDEKISGVDGEFLNELIDVEDAEIYGIVGLEKIRKLKRGVKTIKRFIEKEMS